MDGDAAGVVKGDVVTGDREQIEVGEALEAA